MSALALALGGRPDVLLAQATGSALLGFRAVPASQEDRVIIPDAVNHEYTDDGLLHVGGMEPWTADKVRKSQAAHGVSIVEVAFDGQRWSVVRPSALARRITAYTLIRISGPAAGDPALRTGADPSGRVVLGTLNNCAHGYTPWGTYLTCEENFNGYFVNRGSIPAAQARYGIAAPPAAGYRWHEHDGRFEVGAHPNEPNRFGWVVEIDPYDPSRTPVKRTALGRIKHEGATVTLARDGRVVVYMGDDERFEYVYKFVSRDAYSASSRATNADLLDHGTLYVARYESDGTGRWLELSFGANGLDSAGGFASQADVLVRTRAAADKVGATKMDRPEWVAVHPATREVFVALTNNNQRGGSGRPGTDPANPRLNNVYGHIVRWNETGSDPAATSFRWGVFALAGDPRNANSALRGNVKGDAYGSPDGLWIDGRGVLWIQTDISTSVLNSAPDYANIGNNMMPRSRQQPMQLAILRGARAPILWNVVADPGACAGGPVDARRHHAGLRCRVPERGHLDVLGVPEAGVDAAAHRIERRVGEDPVAGGCDAGDLGDVTRERDRGHDASDAGRERALREEAAQVGIFRPWRSASST